MAQEPHVPTEESRVRVGFLCANGIPESDIAKLIGVSRMTLRKYYKYELKLGLLMSREEVAGHLMRKIREGDLGAIVWWEKTRARMSAPPREEVIRHYLSDKEQPKGLEDFYDDHGKDKDQ